MSILSYLKVLEPRFRHKTFVMILIGIVRRILDLVGLASLLPLIIVILNPESIKGDSFIAKLFQYVGLETLPQFGLTLGIFVLLLLPIKSIFTIWLNRIQGKFLLSIYKYYSQRLYNYYHSRGLLFIRQKYTSQLSFHINGASYGFAMGIIGTIINSASDIFMTLLMGGVVLWMAPLVTLMLLGAMIPVLLIYFTIVKDRLKKIGFEAYEIRRKQTQTVQESLKGHISININDSFKSVNREFEEGIDSIARVDLRNSIYGQIPSVILQICVAIALIILLLGGMTGNTSTTMFILFGFVAVKIMPSILGLANSWNALQNNEHIIKIIEEANQPEEQTERSDEVIPMKFENQVKLNNVTFTFEGNTQPVFSNFSLTINKGESIGFRGTSGVGKSTLFNLLLGFYIPQEGSIYVDGERVSSQNRRSWHKIVGYVEQEVFIKNDTLINNIVLSDTEPNQMKILQALEQVGLKDWYQKQPKGLETILGEGGATVSGGEKQRLGIARALYKEPEILFVDEATSALDINTEEEIISLLHTLRSNGLTLLIISHRESVFKHCNRIIEI